MLRNIKIADLKNAINTNLKIPEEECFLIAKHLVEELNENFEASIKTWIEKNEIINVKFKSMDIFALMYYMNMNYIEAIEALNLYALGNNLESIKTCKKLKRKDILWKALACIFGC